MIFLSACGDLSLFDKLYGPKWTGWLYPTGEMLVSEKLGRFDTLEECRSTALRIGNRFQRLTGKQFDYECGKNCKLDGGPLGLYVCDETVK